MTRPSQRALNSLSAQRRSKKGKFSMSNTPPSNAEIAIELRTISEALDQERRPTIAGIVRLAAQRLEARSEISEAMVERAENEFWRLMKIKGVSGAEAMRAALAAALSGKD